MILQKAKQLSEWKLSDHAIVDLKLQVKSDMSQQVQHVARIHF